ncbi:hypothetical protein [Streptomyces sp. YIM 98790]|nr:hypothetical protein [Streptomyces sp. YIM 98790]
MPSLDQLVRVLKREPEEIQYRPHLLDGCLAKFGLINTMAPSRAQGQ